MSACNDSEKIRKRDVLKKDEFIEIVKDLHHADGVISASKLREGKYSEDSVSMYNFVLKKHNVSRKTFSLSVKYYSKNTEKYVEIYDSLISYYTTIKKEIADKERDELASIREQQRKEDAMNLWELKKEWNLPEDGKRNPIAYKIGATKHGTYTLKAKIKVLKEDKSINQRMTIIANYENGTKDLNTVPVVYDNEKSKNYEVSITTDKNRLLKSISGWVLDHSRNTKEKHVQVRDIHLKFSKDEDVLNDTARVSTKELFSNKK
jgi:hypothetical protein